MAKLRNPLFSFNVRGTLASALTFRRHNKQSIAEFKPTPPDARSDAQLSWRPMYKACIALWHLLSDSEKQEWESLARSRHMTGYSWFLSQCLRPNPGIYLPLAGGTMQGDIDMSTNRILNLPAPVADEEPLRKIDGGGSTSKIEDADADTKVDTEESADEDQVRMDVKGVEAFLLNDDGILTFSKQSGLTAYRATSHQSVSHATVTLVQLNAEYYDVQNEFDPTSTHRFTAKDAGKYLCTCALRWNCTVANKYYQARIQKNGVDYSMSSSHAAFVAGVFVFACTTIELAANDYIELKAYHNAGVSQNIMYTSGHSNMSISKIS